MKRVRLNPVHLRAETLPAITTRVRALDADSAPLWGRRKPIEMLAHLRRNVEVSLGEVPVEDSSTLFSRTFMRWYLFNSGISWPTGKIHAPKVMSPPPEDSFEEERERLCVMMARFVTAAEREPLRRSVHPFFGPLKLSYWSRMLGMHIDYHLMQFGV